MVYERSSKYRWILRDDGAYVYSLEDGAVKVVNETGCLILKLCSDMGVDEIASSIIDEYRDSADPELVKQDVQEFLTHMEAQGYIWRK